MAIHTQIMCAPFLFEYNSIIFLLSYREEEVGWDTEIKDDVIEECNKHGGVIHIYVDKNSAQVFSFLFLLFFLCENMWSIQLFLITIFS